MLGEENATDAELIETGRRFFTAMYGQPEGTSMSLARHNPYTRKNGKPFHPDKGITTYGSKSAVSHEESSHHVMWKAADRQGPLRFWTSLSSDGT